MATLEEASFNIFWTCRISFLSASSWDDKRCESSCSSVEVTKTHLFSELPKSSRQCFASFSVYSKMSLKSCLLLSHF